MRSFNMTLVAAAAFAAAAHSADAASLQVTPLLVEVAAPGATSTLTLRNQGTQSVNGQIRVFRWTQANGQDVLEPTDAVVASPPMASLAGRVDYSVRIVRTSRQPIAQEEAYRLLIDELPDASKRRSGTIAIVLRQSIPVFFTPQERGAPKLAWSVQHGGGKVTVTAKNTGDRRVRISRLQVGAGKNAVSFGKGLVGYALAGSTMSWTRPAPAGFGGGPVKISAHSDNGPINATVAATPGR
jgi:fimbrial chaperone protein